MRTPVQVAPTVYSANIPYGGSSGTFGAATQLTSSLDEDACGFFLSMEGTEDVCGEVRVYTGSAGSEVQIASMLVPASNHCETFFFPVFIPKGSRVTAAATVASGGYSTQSNPTYLNPIRGRSFDPLVSRGRLVTAAAYTPTDVDAGGTANTMGSWVQLTSSTTEAAKGFTFQVRADESVAVDLQYRFDVAIGAASSEQAILREIQVSCGGYRQTMEPSHFGPVWCPIPAGSRIAVRCASSSNATTSRVPRVGLVLWE